MIKGSFTVEATLVMSITMILIMMILLKGYDMYSFTYQKMTNVMEENNFDAVASFRRIEQGEELWSSIIRGT